VDITFLVNECVKLNLGTKEVIEMKINNLEKVNNILKLQGCILIPKNEKYLLIKTPKPTSIFNPDVEINDIINSKEPISAKIKKIKKVIKNFEINLDTKEKLLKYLNSLKKDVNDKLKKEIQEIEKNIKVKSSAFA